MIVAMRDTNIWLDFAFVQIKTDQGSLPRRLRKSKEIMDAWFHKKFISTVSRWNLWEFHSVLVKYILEKKFVEAGYLPH